MHRKAHDSRTKLNAIARNTAAISGKARRFQVDLETKGTLSGSELFTELGKEGFDGSAAKAQSAIVTIEAFIEKKLAEGYRLDFNLVTFQPRLSGALSARDADPETDGLCVIGAVRARFNLRQALKDKVEAVNALAKKYLRVYNVMDTETEKFDVIETEHNLSVIGNDIKIDLSSEDEGCWLEKRVGRRGRSPRIAAKAEVLSSTSAEARVIFHGTLPPGKYNLVIATRCGEGKDYKVRRIAHPVNVV